MSPGDRGYLVEMLDRDVPAEGVQFSVHNWIGFWWTVYKVIVFFFGNDTVTILYRFFWRQYVYTVSNPVVAISIFISYLCVVTIRNRHRTIPFWKENFLNWRWRNRTGTVRSPYGRPYLRHTILCTIHSKTLIRYRTVAIRPSYSWVSVRASYGKMTVQTSYGRHMIICTSHCACPGTARWPYGDRTAPVQAPYDF